MASDKWISVKQALPQPPYAYRHNYLVWVKCDNRAGGYRDTAAFGDYIFEMEDPDRSDPRFIDDPDNDDGNWRGSGWHREEDTHGGPYDTVFVDLNDKVTHWMPLPSPPEQEETK